MPHKPLYLSLIAAGVSAVITMPVYAQLEEVVVTARKKKSPCRTPRLPFPPSARTP